MDARANTRPLKLAMGIALLCAGVAAPCSFDTAPRLFYDVRPDAPVDRYVDGRLGILHSAYARSHLVIAFRHLSGRPPSAAEREGFTELLRHRLYEYPEPQILPQETWERLRTTVRGVPYQNYPDSNRLVDEHEYTWIDNCNGDAFTTASETLAARVKTFGAKSAAVDAWLDAQELVFGNCNEGNATVPDAGASLPELIRYDRRYQQAAADFYAMRYQHARERFLAIAGDAKSPWRATSRIVAARALVRAGSVGGDMAEKDPTGAAQQELRAILADRTMAPLHETAWGLLTYTIARRTPQQRFSDAARGLLQGQPTARRARTDLADYTFLWDQGHHDTATDELTDWLKTFQSGNTKHALERWSATRGTHWLVAALTHVQPGDAAAAKLLRDSANIDGGSPAYASVAYHRVRLMTDAGARRTELDRALATELPTAARNLFLEQRRGVARSLDEFLRDTPVRVVGYGLETAEEETKVWMPPDAAVVFNQWMPLEMLLAVSKDETFPADVRARVARATELRAALLRNPDFDLAYATVKEIYRRPFVRPFGDDEDRPNWWCAFDAYGEADGKVPPHPPFLGDNEAEAEKLRKLGSGATWILRTTIARASSHPDDPRVPEALALAIEGTRWACGDDDTDALAEQAFGVLKKRYPKTKWAQQTKYWHKAAF
jgi:hypothetical protein